MEKHVTAAPERDHSFAAAGDGTRACPRYLRCKLCGFCRPIMNTNGDLGCYDGLREHYAAIERSERFQGFQK